MATNEVGSKDGNTTIDASNNQNFNEFKTWHNVATGENLNFTADVKSTSSSKVNLTSSTVETSQQGSTHTLTTVSGKNKNSRLQLNLQTIENICLF